jgi:serine/threonine protein kinase
VFLAKTRDGFAVKLSDFGDRPDADPRIDLYGAGVVLYEALTGRLPFPEVRAEGDDLNSVFTRLPTLPSELRTDLGLDVDSFITRALARSRQNGFQTADEMRDAWCSTAALEPHIRE